MLELVHVNVLDLVDTITISIIRCVYIRVSTRECIEVCVCVYIRVSTRECIEVCV